MSTPSETPPLRQPSSPRKRGYLFPVLLAAVGVLFLWQGGTRMNIASGKDSIRLDAPGEKTFRIEQPGEYRLWRMKGSAAGDTSDQIPASLPEGAHVEVTQLPESRLIPQRPMNGSMRISVNGVARVALTTLTLPEAGEYRIAAGGTDRRYVLLLDETSAFWQFFSAIFFFVIGATILPAALIWGIIVSRSRAGVKPDHANAPWRV